MLSPIHTATIGGVPLRFFALKAKESGEILWVVFKDLHSAMGQSADDLERCVEVLYLMPAGQSRATIFIDDGAEMIVSCLVAFSFTAGLVSVGRVPLSLAHAFGEAVGDAIDVLLKDLPPDERLERKQKWLSESSYSDFETNARAASRGDQ